MANTRKSTKRAKQANARQDRNQIVRNATRTALKKALEAIKAKDLNQAKDAYQEAVRALSKASSKGAIPTRRAARKVSRLTHLTKKILPAALSSGK